MEREKGFSLLEVMLAIALMGIVAVAFLGALGTGSKVIFIADERATAESLARTEMEYIKNCNYADLPTSWSYELPSNPPLWDGGHTLPPGYDGYSLEVSGNIFDTDGDGDIEVPGDDDGIQKIIVIVKHGSEAETVKEVLTLEDYKVDR
jgi:prepilin-type N-terminal cleavage/methylation domain-containing protein